MYKSITIMAAVTIFLLTASSVLADTHNAVSCSQSDIQAAIDAATDGDIVSVPAGNCTWTGRAGTASYQSSAIYINNKSITLQGAGAGLTNITLNLSAAGTAPSGIYTNAATKAPKITGFRFISDGYMKSSQGGSVITFTKNTKDSKKVGGFRVYKNEFVNTCSWCTTEYNQTRCFGIFGYIYGLIDQNTISYDTSGGVFIDVSQNQGETGFSGDNSWNTALSLGTADAVYIENNTIKYSNWVHGNVTDAGDGGRFVFRFNNVYNIKAESHSACSSGGRATRQWEIYNNRWETTIGATYNGAIFMRGGTGVIFNNTLIGSFPYRQIIFDERRTDTAIGSGYPVCAVALRSRCDGTSSLDGNVSNQGWPCMDQIGRSTGSPGNQASDPAYVWGNTLNGSPSNTVSLNPAYTATSPSQLDHLKADRDWYEGVSKPGYVPYTCPHPLAGSGSCNSDAAGTTGYVLDSSSVTTPSPAVTYEITTSKSGNGTITSSPSGISCGSTCTASYDSGTSVTLTATADSGYTFSGWSGACTGTDTCTVTMTEAKSVTATFTQSTYALSVTKASTNTGTGTVSSSDSGISCGSDCSESYTYGTIVTLTATADSGSSFYGWSGDCTGTSTCQVTMDVVKNVTASFLAQDTPALTVGKKGTGRGKIKSTAAVLASSAAATGSIDCGDVCVEQYEDATKVTLTAEPESGSTFSGWEGACSGTGDCVVTVNAATSVTATFTLDASSTSSTSSVGADGGGGGGCFIATAAYGSYLDPHVMILREFRDNVLMKNYFGRMFVKFYYENSPAVAHSISRNDVLTVAARLALTPFVYAVSYPYATGMILLAALLIAIVVRRKKETHILAHSAADEYFETSHRKAVIRIR